MEAVGLFRDRREMCEENKRKKKKKRRLYNKSLSPAQKKRGHTHIKRGFRAGLRPRVKNGAEN